VCSTTAAQLARICRAIEELAGHPGRRGGTAADSAGREVTADPGARDGAAAGPDRAVPERDEPGPGRDEAAREDALAARLAEIWGMIAEADPELARRVPGYLTAAD
jgi:hypothetical protein